MASDLSPLSRLAVVNPSDSANITLPGVRALYLGVAGNVTVKTADSPDGILLKGLAAGVFHPLRVYAVMATGTTATDIVAGA